MGAKVIPHLLTKLDASPAPQPTELMMVPYDGLITGPLPNEPFLAPDYIFDASRAPRESQGPAKLLVSDQMESLLGWYV